MKYKSMFFWSPEPESASVVSNIYAENVGAFPRELFELNRVGKPMLDSRIISQLKVDFSNGPLDVMTSFSLISQVNLFVSQKLSAFVARSACAFEYEIYDAMYKKNQVALMHILTNSDKLVDFGSSEFHVRDAFTKKHIERLDIASIDDYARLRKVVATLKNREIICSHLCLLQQEFAIACFSFQPISWYVTVDFEKSFKQIGCSGADFH